MDNHHDHSTKLRWLTSSSPEKTSLPAGLKRYSGKAVHCPILVTHSNRLIRGKVRLPLEVEGFSVVSVDSTLRLTEELEDLPAYYALIVLEAALLEGGGSVLSAQISEYAGCPVIILKDAICPPDPVSIKEFERGCGMQHVRVLQNPVSEQLLIDSVYELLPSQFLQVAN